MQAYIYQLLEDIKAAHQPEQMVSYHQTSFSIEKHFEEVERWLEGIEPAHTFAYYCGLLPNQFPPEERLTMGQVRAVSRTFKKLLFSWNLGVDIPDSMPARQAYTFLISILNEKLTWLQMDALPLSSVPAIRPPALLKNTVAA